MSPVKGTRPSAARGRAGPRHRFGAHLSIAGGMHHALEQALRLRCQTVQVFVKNQRQWRAGPLAAADLERWHRLLATPGFGPPVAHATYLINLASPNRTLRARSQRALVEELGRCQQLAIPYLVLHPGSATDGSTDRGVVRVSRALNRVFDQARELETMVLLETTAGQGTALGRSFRELGEVIRGLEDPRRAGICIDTCHVFAAGYDIRSPDVYRTMMAEVEREVGLQRVRCWHLNDSKTDCGSNVDRHEHIGRGRLGSAAMRNVLSDRRFLDVPMILETPKGTAETGGDLDRINLRRLRTIASRALGRQSTVHGPSPL